MEEDDCKESEDIPIYSIASQAIGNISPVDVYGDINGTVL